MAQVLNMSVHALSSIILLPAPPYPCTRAALKAAYFPSLSSALQELADLKQVDTAILEVVVSCPRISDRLDEPRCQIYEEVQTLLAEIYGLISLICAQQTIPADGLGGVDTRVLLLANGLGPSIHSPLSRDDLASPHQVLIIDLATLAASRRTWTKVFKVDGEAGQYLFERYEALVHQQNAAVHGDVSVVGGGIGIISRSTQPAQKVEYANRIHNIVAVGGTFDHLHNGHRLLLSATALLLQPPRGEPYAPPRRLVIGITGDALLKQKKYAEYLQSWTERQARVVDFLLTIMYFPQSEENVIMSERLARSTTYERGIRTRIESINTTIDCVEIQDPFGPTVTDESITALVVSKETRSGGGAVNRKREERSWMALEIFEVAVLDSLSDQSEQAGVQFNDTFESKISSTAIRRRKAESARSSSL